MVRPGKALSAVGAPDPAKLFTPSRSGSTEADEASAISAITAAESDDDHTHAWGSPLFSDRCDSKAGHDFEPLAVGAPPDLVNKLMTPPFQRRTPDRST